MFTHAAMAPTTPAPQSATAADGSLVFRIPALAIGHELEGTRSDPPSQLVHSNVVQLAPTSEQTSSRKKQRTGSELTPAHTSDEASSDAECPPVVAVRARGGRTRKKHWYYVQQKVRFFSRSLATRACGVVGQAQLTSINGSYRF